MLIVPLTRVAVARGAIASWLYCGRFAGCCAPRNPALDADRIKIVLSRINSIVVREHVARVVRTFYAPTAEFRTAIESRVWRMDYTD